MLSSRACARRRLEIASKNVGVHSGNSAGYKGGVWGTGGPIRRSLVMRDNVATQ